tara:strand:+ start:484 stop:657 length:174 start_codon:yes stop_codon:yes gene_type:complete
MKNKESYKYESLMEKIDNLEETIKELNAKLNKITVLWHNNITKIKHNDKEAPKEEEK